MYNIEKINPAVFKVSVAAILIFIVGAGIGIYYQAQNNLLPGSIININSAPLLVKQLSSKAVPSITAFGQVSKINGNNITLTFGGDSIVIPIKNGAEIRMLNPDGTYSEAPQSGASLNDIKLGASLNIAVKVLPSGALQGDLVYIISALK